MKIAIISDIHDNLATLKKFLNWAKKNKIEQLIVCGDLCAPATLIESLAPGFSGKIHLIFGNACYREIETEKVKELSNVIHYGDLGEFEIDNKKIAIIHYPDKAKKLAESGKYDFVFYGHNHKPWVEKIGNTYLANPGTLAGMFYKATFAFWDTETGKLELKILEMI